MRLRIRNRLRRIRIRIICVRMRPIKHIRKHVFKVRQVDFAEIAGVTQATVSRWEDGTLAPSLDELARIRAAAGERRLRWNDKLFFTTPASVHEQAAGAA